MKKSFIGYALTLVMAFGIASCGKSGGGGGGGATGIEAINTGGTSVSQSSAQALSNLDAWYRSTNEGGYNLSPYSYSYDVYRTTSNNTSSGSSNSSCPGKEIKILGMVVGCLQTYSSSGGAQNLTGTPTRVLLTSGMAKSSNAALASIVGQINSGLIVNAIQYGTVYTIVTRKTVSSNYVNVYTIDTNYHSAFQPMMVQDTEASSLTVVNAIVPR